MEVGIIQPQAIRALLREEQILKTSHLADGSPTKAAQYCADLIENGHNDWYLPAKKDEFNQLWLNFGSGKTHTSVGNFDVSGQSHYSSSEYSSQHGWLQRLSDGYQWATGKYDARLLRCVRK